jgi:hypothetical protein
MTRQSTIERAARLTGKGPAMLGRFQVDGDPVDFTVGEEDLDRDTTFWRGVLAGYGVGPGSRIVVVGSVPDSPWLEPPRMAANALGGSYSNVDAWSWDARRLDMYCRRLPVTLVLGLGAETVQALASLTNVQERLGPVPTLLARPDALKPLRGEGVTNAGVLVPLGPALAVTLADGRGMAYDESEWLIEAADGELVVSTRGPRHTRFDRQRTGVAGAVVAADGGSRLVLGS